MEREKYIHTYIYFSCFPTSHNLFYMILDLKSLGILILREKKCFLTNFNLHLTFNNDLFSLPYADRAYLMK